MQQLGAVTQPREEAVQYVTAGNWDGRDLSEEERYEVVSSENVLYVCYCVLRFFSHNVNHEVINPHAVYLYSSYFGGLS